MNSVLYYHIRINTTYNKFAGPIQSLAATRIHLIGIWRRPRSRAHRSGMADPWLARDLAVAGQVRFARRQDPVSPHIRINLKYNKSAVPIQSLAATLWPRRFTYLKIWRSPSSRARGSGMAGPWPVRDLAVVGQVHVARGQDPPHGHI